MVLLSVVFIDVKMPLPVYICGAVSLSYKQFQLMGSSNVKPMLLASTLVSHTAACGVVTFIVFAMQSHIASKLDSEDISSLLVASRRVWTLAITTSLMMAQLFQKCLNEKTHLK